MNSLLRDFENHLNETLPITKEQKLDPFLTWLRESRLQAAQRARSLKFPVWKNSEFEEWRYTDLSELTKNDYIVPKNSSIDGIQNLSLETLLDSDISSILLADETIPRVVLVNGLLIEELSNYRTTSNCKITPLNKLEESQQRLFCRHITANDRSPFPALNSCYLNGGVVVETGKDKLHDGKHPLYVVNIFIGSSGQKSGGGGVHEMYHPRTLFVLDEGSSLNAVEVFVGGGAEKGRRFTNAFTQIFLRDKSTFTRAVLFAETSSTFNVSTCMVNVASNCNLRSSSFMITGKVVRESTECRIVGSNSNCAFGGLGVLTGIQHYDCYTMVNHMKPDSRSLSSYRAVLGGNSVGVFTGRVRIEKRCSGSIAEQDSKSLLLSDNARSFSRPQLYILNDDVQCKHGHACGPVDDDSVLYIMNRGIDEITARKLLSQAFALKDLFESLDKTAFGPLSAYIEKHIITSLEMIFSRFEPKVITPMAKVASKFGRRSREGEDTRLDPALVKGMFPLLRNRLVHGDRQLIYLDNAATTQKPQPVLEAMHNFERTGYSNVHRGVHELSEVATVLLEEARQKVANFVGAQSSDEIVFTSGTTDSLNIAAFSLAELILKPQTDAEVLVSLMEHHSNFVPWQQLCLQFGNKIDYIPVTPSGEFDIDAFKRQLSPKTKIVAIAHVSNVLGTINPIKDLISIARAKSPDVIVVVDGAQAVAHLPVNVVELDCDLYAFSGHKMYGPGGLGVLYGRRKLLEAMPPHRMGGGMISRVSKQNTEIAGIPYKFEAGTPHVTGIIGLGAAVEFLAGLNLRIISRYEEELTSYCLEKLADIPGIRVIGSAKERVSVISFVVESFHAHDVGTLLDAKGIAVRAGHHCAMPLMDEYKIEASVRVGFGCYTTFADVDSFIIALKGISATPEVAVQESSIYKELIMDHNRHPHNFHELHDCTATADGYNRLCGDQYRVYVKVGANGAEIEKVSFTGTGCAISKASTSIMTRLMEKLTVSDALTLIDTYREWLMASSSSTAGKKTKESSGSDRENPEIPEKLLVFSEIHKYPARVKCATIGWHALKVALGNIK